MNLLSADCAKGAPVHIFDNIPEELTSLDQWVLYRTEPKANSDKLNKIPYQPNGRKASSINKSTWSSFEAVFNAYEDGGFAGIGFVFAGAHIGVDIDGCVTDGQPNDLAWNIIQKLSSYTEFSPSGSGIHIIVLGKFPAETGRKAEKYGLEMYTKGRFFTFTGKPVPNTSPHVEERSEAMQWLFDTYFPKTEKVDQGLPQSNDLTPEDIRQRAMGDEKFMDLMNGDLESYGGDHSRADGAFCLKLAFYTERNPKLMDEIFRKSKLMRPKWDHMRGEKTYGQYQIDNAVRDCKDVWESREDAHKSKKKSKKTEATLKFAEKVCSKHRFASVQEHGKIFKYDSCGIYKCVASPKVSGAIENIILDTDYGRMFSVAKRKNVVTNISTITYTPVEKLNPENYVNFKNGVLNVVTRKFFSHSPDKIFTVQLPYDYDPSAKSDEWINYLKVTLENDLNKINPLQEFCGYCFLKTCKYEKALFLQGPAGSGKSTFTETIREVFGHENCASTSLTHLADPVLRCSIRGKHVNFDTDLPEKAENFEDIFQKLASGEAIKFNEKFLPASDEKTRCKLIFNVNDFPYIKGSSDAFYRRMLLVKFEKEFDDDTADVNLKHKLRDPKQLSGIFNWCLDGLHRLIKNDRFSHGALMRKHINELKKDNNPVLQFIDDEVSFVSGVCIPSKDLWESYKEWSIKNGHSRPLSERKFNIKFFEAVRKRGVTRCRRPDHDRSAGFSGIDVLKIDTHRKWGASKNHGEWDD